MFIFLYMVELLDKMSEDNIYTLDEFMKDIKIGLEMDLVFNGKEYTLSRNPDTYIFAGVKEQNYALYSSYEELLNSIRIEWYSIKDIIDQQLYEDW